MNTVSEPPSASPTASLPPRPLGGLLELFFFFASAFGLFLLVWFTALSVLIYDAHQQEPGLPWTELNRQVADRIQHNAFFAVPVQLAYYALLIFLLYALVRGRRGLPFWRSLALRPLSRPHVLPAVGAGVILAFLVQFSSLLVPPPEQPAFDKLLTTRAAAFLILGSALLVAPLVEELVFRGYIYTLLEGLWGMTPAVLISGLLFGAIHFPQLYPGYFQMGLLCGVGLVFSLARARTGTVLASILLHFSYNATISLLFLASPQFRNLPAVALAQAGLPAVACLP